MRKPPTVDTLAGRYRLESEIGAGGMGVVWRARDERLGRDVAVKLLAADAVGSEVARARLMREARAAAQLQHEGIVHVYDVGETDDGGAFLVMELVSGHGLRRVVEQGTLSIAERIELVIAIGDALSAAHELGIVHRDVKPDNVLVRTNGRPVLLDFGLAKPLASEVAETRGDKDVRLTGTGAIVGTPAYLAPEQVKGEALGAAADQFSLAVMTFELLVGRLPWNGKTVIEVIASMLHDQPPSAEELVPELPTGVDAVLLRALDKNPNARFPSVVEFVEALRAFFPEIKAPRFSTPPPATPRDLPSARGGDMTVGTVETAISRKVLSARVPRGRRVSTLVALALGVAALAAVGIAAQRRSRERSAPVVAASSRLLPLSSSSVVACPLFRVNGELPESANGWLGAAAAALACDRVQALLGGESSRTLAPAELVPALPREPKEDAPSDPFVGAGIAENALAAAKRRAPVYLDGVVTKTPLDFTVSLALRARDGQELARGRGRGDELFEAVSLAVRELRPAFGEGRASAFQKEWLRVETRQAALEILDVTTGLLIESDEATRRACERAQAERALRPDMAYLLRSLCHERLQRSQLAEEPPPIDASSPGALVTTIAAQRARGGPEPTKQRVARLREAEAKAHRPDERALVAATIAELLYHAGDLVGSQSAARKAGQLSPKLVDPRGTPWHRLSFAAEFDRAIGRVHVAWLPWEPLSVVYTSWRDPSLFDRETRAARSYLLCRRGYYARSYAELLAAVGKAEEARNIADQLGDDYLRVRADHAATRYQRALDLAVGSIAKLTASDSTASAAFHFASAGAEAARYLGRPATFVEDLVERYLDPEPPYVRVGVAPFFQLVYACVEAPKPTARHCLKRLREVYERGDAGGVIAAMPAFLEATQRWVEGDARGAAKGWRPMLRQGGNLGEGPLRHVIVAAFERADLPELAERMDAPFLQLLDQPDAADLAFARVALRAEKKGDVATAQKLAQACVERWQHADEDVPARRDMLALLERLESRRRAR